MCLEIMLLFWSVLFKLNDALYYSVAIALVYRYILYHHMLLPCIC